MQGKEGRILQAKQQLGVRKGWTKPVIRGGSPQKGWHHKHRVMLSTESPPVITQKTMRMIQLILEQ